MLTAQKGEADQTMRGLITEGLELTRHSEKDGGFKEYFSGKCAMAEDTADAQIRKASTAIMMQNTRNWLASLDEATKAVQVGGFVDYLFPLIRASFTNNPAFDLVSVQPMSKRVGLIFFLNYVIGQTKGSTIRGTRVFDALEGYSGSQDYSGEKITDESVGTTGSSVATVALTFSYLPIRPGSVLVTIADTTNIVFRDDGKGSFVKESGGSGLAVSSPTIDYQTGAATITVTGGNFPSAAAVTASYEYDSEVSGQLPQIDVQLTSLAIQAQARRLRVRYSQDAAYDLRAEYGIDADAVTMQGVAEMIRAEQAREIINDLWNASRASSAFTFPISTHSMTSGFSKLEAFRDIIYPIEDAANDVFEKTQRVHPNWIIADTKGATILKSLPDGMFQSAGIDDTNPGVQFIGTLLGRYRCWQDPLLNTQTGTVAGGNLLMGYKGADWVDAAYVWAVYQPLFTTAAVTLDDFMTRKALAMRYAKKLVNPRVYRRIQIM